MSRLPVFVLVLLSAAAAHADDACRAGESALADRRALTALQVAIDGACACENPSSGRARPGFLRCAREQIAAALGAGTLRRACVGAARADVRRTTCGSNRIACGRVDDDGAACRLAAGDGRNACGARAGETACAAETRCSAVVDWTAGTCRDPRQHGPYGVGVQVLRMAKDSVYTPGTERVLETHVWYPAARDAGPIDARYRAVLDAPLDASGGPYPVLVFSHGSCGYPTQSLFLTPLLASRGYVVIAPSHPGNTILEFPACGGIAAQAASANERPADVIYALDQMLAAGADAESPFFGALDTDRIGMSGHSFGGFTTYLAVAREPRFKVALPLAAAVPGVPRLTIPSLTLLGEIDSRVNNDAIRAAYAAALAPKLLVEILDGGHYVVSDNCFPSADCNPPLTLTQAEAHEQALRWIVPFLDRYLAGDATAEPLLVAGPPGSVVTQER
jgi:dienelactone hydrolase